MTSCGSSESAVTGTGKPSWKRSKPMATSTLPSTRNRTMSNTLPSKLCFAAPGDSRANAIRIPRAELEIRGQAVVGYDVAPPLDGPIHLSPEMIELARTLLAELEAAPDSDSLNGRY